MIEVRYKIGFIARSRAKPRKIRSRIVRAKPYDSTPLIACARFLESFKRHCPSWGIIRVNIFDTWDLSPTDAPRLVIVYPLPSKSEELLKPEEVVQVFRVFCVLKGRFCFGSEIPEKTPRGAFEKFMAQHRKILKNKKKILRISVFEEDSQEPALLYPPKPPQQPWQ